VHLDCGLSYGLVRELVPGLSRERWAAEFVAPPRCRDLVDLLKRIDRPLLLMQEEKTLQRVTDDLFDQLRDDAVVYAEVRFAPLLHTRNGLSPERVLDVVARAAAKASRRTGVDHGLLVCTLRHFSREESLRTAEITVGSGAPNVVGLDLAGDEAGFSLDAHTGAFDLARERGLGLTAHAGEARGAESVAEALDRLRPSRIGHGVRSVEDPAVVARLRESGVHLEVCPTSNVQSGVCEVLADHPIEALRRAGVRLGVNTDGRTLCGVSLADEYAGLVQAFGWSEAEARESNRAAAEASFAPAEVKARVLAAVGTPPGRA
jgi:adenosine deaminase